jgi:hypothetical protein
MVGLSAGHGEQRACAHGRAVADPQRTVGELDRATNALGTQVRLDPVAMFCRHLGDAPHSLEFDAIEPISSSS